MFKKIRILIIVSVFVTFLCCLSVWVLKSNNDSNVTIVSSIFTVIQTTATILALIIAVLLFDKFGMNSKFKDKQIEKVLELAEFMSETGLYIKVGRLGYTNMLRQNALNDLVPLVPQYNIDKKKELLFDKAYEKNFLNKVNTLLSHHWFPAEIREKAKIFNIYGFGLVENNESEEYAKLKVNDIEPTEYWHSIPSTTFEDFGIGLAKFFEVIETWLNNHSEIGVGLKIFKRRSLSKLS
jgi:hypothetical protein